MTRTDIDPDRGSSETTTQAHSDRAAVGVDEQAVGECGQSLLPQPATTSDAVNANIAPRFRRFVAEGTGAAEVSESSSHAQKGQLDSPARM